MSDCLHLIQVEDAIRILRYAQRSWYDPENKKATDVSMAIQTLEEKAVKLKNKIDGSDEDEDYEHDDDSDRDDFISEHDEAPAC